MNSSFRNTLHAASFFLCGALTLSALQATALQATRADDPPSQRVSYADLDISKPAGAKVLYSRIVAAAKRVCELNGYKDLSTMRWVQVCTDHAIDNAVRDVDSPALSALRPGSVAQFARN
ncbi:MAG TPA: UrcA family protein [Steroidobacteraceae bacterium]|jgi:UrcA family protein|nr:UrcA family protein [Steroidobacteraceae bacterium]